MTSLRAQMLGIAFGFTAAAVLAATPAWSGASILIDADSGKVLRADNATYPWYPASTTKLMTLYMTLSAVRDNRITFDTLFTVSRNANLQAPVKMGLPVGTQVTVDNALKMMMVKSANDMAVVLAEGVGGSVDDFAQQMTDTAHKLGMSESNFVNPNGLPADGQITSARDLAILARALIREFPDYSFYWHVPAIKFGRRIVRNYNPLLGRYPGADGMKTGFICASGFNLVATATRNNKHLIAVVLGAPSGAARAIKAAEMLESGFAQNPLSWLTPSLGMVDALAPMDVAPPNLQEQTCGKHRRRPAAEDEDMDADGDNGQAAAAAASETRSLLLSALRAPTNPFLLSDLGPVMPVVVYTGPTRSPSQLATLSSDIAAEPDKKKNKHHKATAARSNDDQAAPEKPANKKSIVAKPTDAKPAAKPTDTKTTAQISAPTTAAAPKKQAKPKPPVTAPPGQ
ncbi:MAG TPA: D-alanyl-D-alanine carboxypeptidase family protein [Xanthobacteraceae bacterium]|nr:D-alanyl-D-alanine carboxypeptidase family protein [Xanthobacteraceae bacterium]